MTYSGVFENVLRVATIEAVDYEQQTASIRMYDRVDDRSLTVPLPQPAGGTDSGVYIHPEPGSLALIGYGFRETPYIVANLPNTAFARDITSAGNTTNIPSDFSGYPSLNPGEVALSGKAGNEIKLNNRGCIDVNFGLSRVQLDASNRFITQTNEWTNFLESSSSVFGPIERDLRLRAGDEEKTENKSSSVSYYRVLSQIGREPDFTPVTFTTRLGSPLETLRNPAFVERKDVVYEFARSYQVGTVDEEVERFKNDEDFSYINQPNRRDATKYDILNLNTNHPNSLIEKVEGTLIDIYGNVLDLNRNVIQFPDEAGRKNANQRVPALAALLRRSIKLHYEINTRKDATGEVAIDVLDGQDVKIGATQSRWSVDVDGEGLTKINIPASSNIGNIPLLTRYVNEHQRANRKDAAFKAESKRDVLHMGFQHPKSPGVSIEPSEYSPSNIVADAADQDKSIVYKTVYHDIVFTASSALVATGSGTVVPAPPRPTDIGVDVELTGVGGDDETSLNNLESAAGDNPGPGSASNGPSNAPAAAIQTTLNNLIPDDPSQTPQGNAGGRSIHMNLDGSMEMNIGRDVIDGKSLTLDLAGGIVSRIGRTKDSSNAASVMTQLDGSLFIQVGGDTIESEDPVDDPVVKILVRGSKGDDELVIDQNAVKLKAANKGSPAKNIVLESAGNIVLKAGGTILLAGSNVGIHGDSDPDGNAPAPKRVVLQKGKEI